MANRYLNGSGDLVSLCRTTGYLRFLVAVALTAWALTSAVDSAGAQTTLPNGGGGGGPLIPDGGLSGGPAAGAPAPGTPTPLGAGSGLEPGAALESAISGDGYILGPGDVLSVSIWGPQSFTYSLPVTLEGQVLIPTMGPLAVDRLTLTAAKEKIRRRILRDFKNVQVTVSLVALRKFQVHVLGQVTTPGTYLGSAVDRVSSAVGWAGGLLEDGSQRRIVIRNKNEVRAEADLFAFLQRGVEEDNPTLRDGDVVYVPFRSESFTVQGAVNQPGPIEFVPGDRLSDALFFAGGLEQGAFVDTVELVRYRSTDRDGVRFFIPAEGGISRAGRARGDVSVSLPESDGTFSPFANDPLSTRTAVLPDFELQSRDIVFVRERTGSRRQNLVEVVGEVEFPGTYPIIEGETRLSDILDASGGVTPDVFLAESFVRRRTENVVEDREFDRLSKMTVGEMTADEYEYFKVRSREYPGRMVVDFEDLLSGRGQEHDIILQPGDIVRLARKRDFISVIGLASEPGNIPYESGLSARDYVARAGGYAEDADKGKARVIRAGTGEWIGLGDVGQVGPGDTIWIPEKPERDYWGLFKDTLSVTTQILTVYLIIDRATDGN